MFIFDRPLADCLIQPLDRAPVLSIVIPTFGRPIELVHAISSITDQIDEALVGKVEIIVSDNASGPQTHAILTRLAATYPWFSYYIHTENYGGMYQVASAADRSRGRWTWVFGDDDALAPGGLKTIIEVLEREQPAFLTVNRQVWNKTLDQCLAQTRHDLPDTRFDTFIDLLAVFGFDQLSFFTSQIYEAEIVRAVDFEPYANSVCRYAQLPYYLEGFHDRSAYYLSVPVILHRWDKDDGAVHAANFHSLATSLPDKLQLAIDRVGLGTDLFEKISGRRSLLGPETRKTTFVDNILQNLWRCVAVGAAISDDEWAALHRLAAYWRPGRAQDLRDVHDAYQQIANAFAQYQSLIDYHQACAAPGRQYSPEEIELLKQSEAAIRTLQGNINDARTMASDIAAGFG